MSQNGSNPDLVSLTARIVSAYIQNNTVNHSEVTDIIGSIHRSLQNLSEKPAEIAEAPKPAVPIRQSITPDYIICLEDGKKFKIMKRHLTTVYGMTPAEYRRKWNLPPDYPMVAPNYAQSRSDYARERQKQSVALHNLKPGARAKGRVMAQRTKLPVVVKPA